MTFIRSLLGSSAATEKNSITPTTFFPINKGKAKPALTPIFSANFALGKFVSLVTSIIHSGFLLTRTLPGSPIPGPNGVASEIFRNVSKRSEFSRNHTLEGSSQFKD